MDIAQKENAHAPTSSHGPIPGTFIDPQWDLMYFVETPDNQGNGRVYLDTEQEMPYAIVELAR